jgi:hypothetical protein
MNKASKKKKTMAIVGLGFIFLQHLAPAIKFGIQSHPTTIHRRHSFPPIFPPVFFTMSSIQSPAPPPDDQLAELHVVVDKIATSLATVQGNQGQLTVAVNRLQSKQLLSSEKTSASSTGDAVTHAVHHDHKLLFLTFGGTEDPLLWLNRCEQFFRIQETVDVGKVFLATFYMMGDVSQWYTLLECNHGQPTSWDEFTMLVNKMFEPPLWGNALGELIQLHQEGSVADYQAKFMSLLARCEDLAEKHQINIFIAGLQNPLRIDVELENPGMLHDAMALARAYEQRLALVNDVSAKHPSSCAAPAHSALKTLSLPATSLTVGAKDSTTTTTPVAPCLKWLTATEIAAKWEKGQCYNCTEKFSREHLKICPAKGIYLLPIDDTKELLAPDRDEPRISLNAITGILPVATMCLAICINPATVTVMVDSGSTHSFISEMTVRWLHLYPTPRQASMSQSPMVTG